MWKRFITPTLLLCGSGFASAAPIQADGCAVLARVVFEEVQSSALTGPGKSGPWVINQGGGEIRSCKTVARTVSRAFSQAMGSAGHTVMWSGAVSRPLYDDLICDSIFINHCTPHPGGEIPDIGRMLSPVAGLWQAVSTTVMRQMHNPYSSDEVTFREDELRLRLGLALRTAGRVSYSR